MFLPPPVQLICWPARDLQTIKHHSHFRRRHTFGLSRLLNLCDDLSPKGSSFSTGTKLLLSNSARILLWRYVSSFGLKTLFPADTEEMKWNLLSRTTTEKLKEIKN